MNLSFRLIFIAAACLGPARSANILVMSTAFSPSHSLWFNKLAKQLLDRGHQVTLFDVIDRKEEIKNLTRIFLEGAFDVEDMQTIGNLEQLSQGSWLSEIQMLYRASADSCGNQLKSAGARRFMESVERGEEHFQLVIHDGINCESFLGWVWRLPGRPALVQATAYGHPMGMLLTAGDPIEPAYMVADMARFCTPMGFVNRVYNTLYHVYHRYVYSAYMSGQNAAARKFFGADLPPLESIAHNTCVFLVNSHPVLDGVRPHVPAVVPVAGLHVEKSNKMLPQELENFINGAKHGVIYFSLGTNILSSNMDTAKRDMFLEVFRELPQRVLWKWESDDIPNKPPNVMVSKWFPQSQILAHKNVKLYISHGGMLSSQEALYHGTKMVVIPFFADQHSIAERLKDMGVSLSLDYAKITKESIKEAVQTVLNQPSFSENMRIWSRKFVDWPTSPQERAVFWIEYALRHPDCSHFRSPAVDMPPYQRMLLDVYLLLGAAILVPIIILVTCLRLICRKTAKRPVSAKQKRN